MAKAVADVNTESQGGFASDDGAITGFSHLHDSGTGGVSYSPPMMKPSSTADGLGVSLLA